MPLWRVGLSKINSADWIFPTLDIWPDGLLHAPGLWALGRGGRGSAG
ncbi:MAG: hypothetical protein ACOX08_00280 [Methanobacterium sp.]